MKKLFPLAIMLVLFTGCESDDNSDTAPINTPDNELLVKKITETSTEGDYTSILTEEYRYDDNKLVEKNSSSENSNSYYRTEYIYSSNLISKAKEYYSFNNQENLSSEIAYFYDSNDRIIRIEAEYVGDGMYTTNYTYDSNGNLSLINEDGCTYEIVFSNGNPVSSSSNVDCEDQEFSSALSFDNNPSAFSSLAGWRWFLTNLTESEYLGFTNNVTRIIYSNPEGSQTINFSYDYNNDGYPRNISTTDGDYESTIVIEYY